MINQLGQVMLYVDNQDKVKQFWTEKAGFVVISETDYGQGMKAIEIAPTKESETSFVLHNKEIIAKMNPGMNLETPSLMFYTKNIDELYANFKDKRITVGELVDMPMGRVFNFADDEGHYFAVMEK